MSTEQGPKKRSLLKWPLLASLAVNLFLGGVLIGHVYSEGMPHFFKRERPAPYMTKDLSPESREVVRQVFRDHSGRIHVLWRELREKREALRDLLAAEPLDEDGVRKGLQEMGRVDGLIQAEFHKATLEIARKLPAEERRKLNLQWKRDHRSGRGEGAGPGYHKGGMMAPPPQE